MKVKFLIFIQIIIICAVMEAHGDEITDGSEKKEVTEAPESEASKNNEEVNPEKTEGSEVEEKKTEPEDGDNKPSDKDDAKEEEKSSDKDDEKEEEKSSEKDDAKDEEKSSDKDGEKEEEEKSSDKDDAKEEKEKSGDKDNAKEEKPRVKDDGKNKKSRDKVDAKQKKSRDKAETKLKKFLSRDKDDAKDKKSRDKDDAKEGKNKSTKKKEETKGKPPNDSLILGFFRLVSNPRDDDYQEFLKAMEFSREDRETIGTFFQFLEILKPNKMAKDEYAYRFHTAGTPVRTTKFKLGEEYEDQLPDGRKYKAVVNMSDNKVVRSEKHKGFNATHEAIFSEDGFEVELTCKDKKAKQKYKRDSLMFEKSFKKVVNMFGF